MLDYAALKERDPKIDRARTLLPSKDSPVSLAWAPDTELRARQRDLAKRMCPQGMGRWASSNFVLDLG